MRAPVSSRRSGFERAYTVVVLVKGLDGALELLAGLVLLVLPGAAAQALVGVAVPLAEASSGLQQALAQKVAAAGSGIAVGDPGFAAFLLVHGIVKLLTVIALLRRAVHWYPWAMGALGVLLVAQVVDVIVKPGPGGVALAALDVFVLALVVWEYRRLRSEVADPAPQQDPVAAG